MGFVDNLFSTGKSTFCHHGFSLQKGILLGTSFMCNGVVCTSLFCGFLLLNNKLGLLKCEKGK